MGLVPGKPFRILGTWNGVTYPVYYGFVDSWAPKVYDVLNQDCVLQASDVLKMLAQAYICNPTLYPDAVLSFSPVAYWRCTDPGGSTSAADISGHSNAGELVALPSGEPGGRFAFGSQDPTGAGSLALLSSAFTGGGSGAILYDPATCLALACPPGSGSYLTATTSPLTAGEPWAAMTLFQANRGEC